MAPYELPAETKARVEHVLWNVTASLLFATVLSWLVLVVPDPDPLVALPMLWGVWPSAWLVVVLFVPSFAVLSWYRGRTAPNSRDDPPEKYE